MDTGSSLETFPYFELWYAIGFVLWSFRSVVHNKAWASWLDNGHNLMQGFSSKLVKLPKVPQSPDGVPSSKLYVDVPAGPWKFDFLYTNFHTIISILFLKENHQFCSNRLLFNIICSKYTQFLYFGFLHLWWKPIDRYTEVREIAPQKAGTYTYTISMWEPPPPPRPQSAKMFFEAPMCNRLTSHQSVENAGKTGLPWVQTGISYP